MSIMQIRQKAHLAHFVCGLAPTTMKGRLMRRKMRGSRSAQVKETRLRRRMWNDDRNMVNEKRTHSFYGFFFGPSLSNDRFDRNIFFICQLQHALVIGLLQVDDLVVVCADHWLGIIVRVDKDHISLHSVAQGDSVIEISV